MVPFSVSTCLSFSQIFFHYRLLQSIEGSSPCCLSFLYIAVSRFGNTQHLIENGEEASERTITLNQNTFQNERIDSLSESAEVLEGKQVGEPRIANLYLDVFRLESVKEKIRRCS